MPGGAQIGNQNASKGGVSKDPDYIRKQHREYARRYRKLHAGDISVVERRFAGRPPKVVEKGDIFDVAARLAAALKQTLNMNQLEYFTGGPSKAKEALQMWHDYWEKD